MRILLATFSLIVIQAAAAPDYNDALVERAINCNAVTKVVNAVKALGGPATSFAVPSLVFLPLSLYHILSRERRKAIFLSKAV